MNQNYLIGNIAAALPSDYYLVVKDHPTMIGLRKPEFYQDILSNTNVILLHHTFDSIHLIKRSDIIFTIVGSAAIEANIIGKPSILFGRYAFDTTNLISFCPDFWQLPEMINKKLNQSHSQEDIKRHAYALLAAKISGSHVGRIPFTEDEMEDYGHLEDKMIKGYVDELKELGVLNIKSSVNS
jgi:capsule polysaccharide export protein KpsC/LpsZ